MQIVHVVVAGRSKQPASEFLKAAHGKAQSPPICARPAAPKARHRILQACPGTNQKRTLLVAWQQLVLTHPAFLHTNALTLCSKVLDFIASSSSKHDH